MKHFYSHALMLLVQVPDKAASCRLGETEIDTKTMDRRINWSGMSDQRPPSTQ
jgi:hypothetical protein